MYCVSIPITNYLHALCTSICVMCTWIHVTRFKVVHKRSVSDSQLHKMEMRFVENGSTKVSPVKIKKFNTLLSQPVVDIGALLILFSRRTILPDQTLFRCSQEGELVGHSTIGSRYHVEASPGTTSFMVISHLYLGDLRNRDTYQPSKTDGSRYWFESDETTWNQFPSITNPRRNRVPASKLSGDRYV